ncbi:metallophosphoesterase [Staphylothermus marinus F1]|uniref:Metallophosphoesterase n=1 Tax=Staphylothermus marinus (strain ATCC 43588 / DSM 3639 / JCM 9404 / F1) TaxID=399550 RepID=A3DKM7_STAMF|nr:DNA repair exonuclease [Staphylothermus marinus]ABN69187.1 metallophosphoesterase [Staphylothermus marinus F1]
MLLIHTADLHIGAFSNRPLRNANVEAFEKIADYTIDNKIPYLVIAGDFFERPRIENFEVLRRIYRILRRLKENNIYVVSIPGSHDSSPRGADILTLLNEAGLIHVPMYQIGEKLVLYPLKLGDIVFYAIPGLKNNLETIYLRDRKVVFKQLEGKVENIVVLAHTSVKFAGYDPSIYSYRYGKAVIENQNILSTLPRNTKYLALGHIHFPLPLFDEAVTNIAYPGAPVGRDASDLEETYLLRKKHSRDRRFLLIDISEEKTIAKSIWEPFNIYVEYIKDYYKGFNDTVQEVKKVIKDLPVEGYNALILDIEGIPLDDRNKLIHKLREIEQQKRILIHLKMRGFRNTSELEISFEDIGDIEEIERIAVEEFARKLGIKASPQKILELINILSKEKSPDTNETEFYESLFKELKPIMEEILGVNKD